MFYTKVIERNPNVQNVYAMRGLSYVFLKKHDLALADYLKAVEKKPTDGGLFLAIGNIYRAKQNYNAAVEAYTKSIVLKDSYFARKARGKTYVETQRYDLAKHDFACMEVLWPKQEETVICKAGLYGLLGEDQGCMEILQQGLSQFPNQPVLLFHMGQCYEKLGQQGLALQYYEKAMANESSKSTEKLTVQAKKKLKLRLAGNWRQETAWVFGF